MFSLNGNVCEKRVVKHICESALYENVCKNLENNLQEDLVVWLKPCNFAPAFERERSVKQMT